MHLRAAAKAWQVVHHKTSRMTDPCTGRMNVCVRQPRFDCLFESFRVCPRLPAAAGCFVVAWPIFRAQQSYLLGQQNHQLQTNDTVAFITDTWLPLSATPCCCCCQTNCDTSAAQEAIQATDIQPCRQSVLTAASWSLVSTPTYAAPWSECISITSTLGQPSCSGSTAAARPSGRSHYDCSCPSLG